MATLAIAPSLFDELFTEREEITARRGQTAPVGGERTLDEVLVGAWEALSAHLSTACPVCDGELVPQYGAHSRPVGGRCKSCASEFS
jgi:hypothetical protein